MLNRARLAGAAFLLTVLSISAARSLNVDALIFAVHSELCLDVAQGSKEEWARLQQWPCHNGDNQKFLIRNRGNGMHEIIAAHSDLCLDVSGASMANGAPIIQFRCHGGTNQRFLIDGGNGRQRVLIKPVHSSKCLDIEAGTVVKGAKLIQFDCHGQNNQRFNIN